MTLVLQDWWYSTLLGLGFPRQPPLVGDTTADAVVVGGGAAGLAAAARLHEGGLDVVLLERTLCGGSSTGRSAGFLTPDSELELDQLVRRYGEPGARDLWEGASSGVDLIRERVAAHGIACDLLKQDSLFAAHKRSGWGDVEREAAARKRLGYAYRLYTAEELPEVLGSREFHGAVRYPDTYAMDGLRYAQGLKAALVQEGVRVHESSEVVAIRDNVVRTHLGSVRAKMVVACIDKPQRRLTPYAANVYHAQTFLTVSEPLSKAEVEAVFPSGPLQCWDTDLVYTYWRLTGDRRMLLGGGTPLTTFSRDDVTSPRVARHLVRDFRRKFPALRGLKFIQYWPGRIDTTRDLMPTILRDAGAPWLHFVLGCVGLPWATFAGDLVARHVLGKDEDFERRYYRYFSPDRHFLLALPLQRLIGKQLMFSFSNAYAKYYERDVGRVVPYDPERF